jgi:hypothetical protein
VDGSREPCPIVRTLHVLMAALPDPIEGVAQLVDPAGIPALQDAIRHMHGCESRWVESN